MLVLTVFVRFRVRMSCVCVSFLFRVRMPCVRVLAPAAVVVPLVSAAAVHVGDFAAEEAGHGDPGGVLHADVEL